MDEFGIMSWAIIDREEEIFELEDVRDEDKVMLALWNRWIMLNRCVRLHRTLYQVFSRLIWWRVYKDANSSFMDITTESNTSSTHTMS